MHTITKTVADRAALVGAISEVPPTALMTSAEAAAYLGTSMGVLANWRSLRHGPRYCGSGSFIRYRLGDLDGWMSERASEIAISSGATSNPLTSQGNSNIDAGDLL